MFMDYGSLWVLKIVKFVVFWRCNHLKILSIRFLMNFPNTVCFAEKLCLLHRISKFVCEFDLVRLLLKIREKSRMDFDVFL